MSHHILQAVVERWAACLPHGGHPSLLWLLTLSIFTNTHQDVLLGVFTCFVTPAWFYGWSHRGVIRITDSMPRSIHDMLQSNYHLMKILGDLDQVGITCPRAAGEGIPLHTVIFLHWLEGMHTRILHPLVVLTQRPAPSATRDFDHAWAASLYLTCQWSPLWGGETDDVAKVRPKHLITIIMAIRACDEETRLNACEYWWKKYYSCSWVVLFNQQVDLVAARGKSWRDQLRSGFSIFHGFMNTFKTLDFNQKTLWYSHSVIRYTTLPKYWTIGGKVSLICVHYLERCP